MPNEVNFEDLGVCVGCNQPLRAGEVVTPWDDEIGHADCKNPTCLTFPNLDDESPPAVVLIGSPAKYVSVDLLRKVISRPAPSEGLTGELVHILATGTEAEMADFLGDNGEAILAALAQQDAMREAAKETTRIIEWLRGDVKTNYTDPQFDIGRNLADAIERGEHRVITGDTK